MPIRIYEIGVSLIFRWGDWSPVRWSIVTKAIAAEQQGARIQTQMYTIPEWLCFLLSALLSPLNPLLGFYRGEALQGLAVSLFPLISTVHSMWSARLTSVLVGRSYTICKLLTHSVQLCLDRPRVSVIWQVTSFEVKSGHLFGVNINMIKIFFTVGHFGTWQF